MASFSQPGMSRINVPTRLLSAGFTLDYTVNDNVGLRVSYHSLVGGDSNLDGDMFRINVNFAWHPLIEKIKKLGGE